MLRKKILSASALLVLAAAPLAVAGPICLRGIDVDSTQIKSDFVILFHMRDGSTYQNTLPQRCPGLKAATNGFTYEPTNSGTDELCGNLGSFRVNEGPTGTLGDGPVCLFGPFTLLSPAPHH